LGAEEVSSFVDQYAGTQVRELLLNVNAMRAGFPSKTRSSFWDGYDPKGPDNQELFASVPAAEAKPGKRIDAVVKGRVIALTGDVPAGLTLRLSDKLLTLDEPLTVTVNGKEVFSGKVSRTAMAIEQSLAERADPAAAATAVLTIKP
jgi:hypothetical protein